MPLRPSVLIVDDDPSHLRIYGWIVEAAGYRAIPGLVHLREVELPDGPADLVLLDYHLNAQVTAAQVANLVKATHPNAPVIVLSDALVLPEDIAPSVDGFVRKGDPAKLVDTLGTFLQPPA